MIIPCMNDKQTFNKIQLLHIIMYLQSQTNKEKNFFFGEQYRKQ